MEKFENEFAEIFFDENLNALKLVFKKQAPGQEFINLNQKLIEIFLKLSTNKLMVDGRKMGVISLEGQHWVANHVFSALITHLKNENLYHAQLLPKEDVFAKVSGNNVRNKGKSVNTENLVMETFFNEDEAIEWLKKF